MVLSFSLLLHSRRGAAFRHSRAWADIPVPVALAKAVRAAVPTDAEREQYSDTCRVLGGIIVHVASTSRPDVAVGAQLISAAPPSELRQRLSKRILGYLARTADLRITYSKSASAELQCAFLSMTGEDDTSIRRRLHGWPSMQTMPPIVRTPDGSSC